MSTRTRVPRTIRRTVLVVGLTLLALLTPLSTLAAQRDGAVLFFSWEDLTQALSNPSLPDLSPSFLWRDPQSQAHQESPIEQSYRWRNGLGVDSYAHPGAHMPLWGY